MESTSFLSSINSVSTQTKPTDSTHNSIVIANSSLHQRKNGC